MTGIQAEGKRPKPTPLPHMRLWFGNLVKILEKETERIRASASRIFAIEGARLLR